MTNLLIEIGNTTLKASWSDGMTLGRSFRYQGEDIFGYISSIIGERKPEVMVVCSSFVMDDGQVDLLSSMCCRLVLMDPSRTEEVCSHGFPSYLSPDRAASLIAARYLFSGKGCMVFDFGTMLTVDIIESDGEYVGGNISLGMRTRFKAVNRYSRSLPLVDNPSTIMQAGTSTISSIESGVVSGIMFEIQGYMSLFPEKEVVFTGGDSLYFVKRMKNSIFAVCNLVLMGLALISCDYVKRND
ncbi:MAG: type III pantothenate kinase [Bacteroidales bacterium]|nr:type III pantothenate kinase [Candidatus Cryptobacteroides faecihippi]MCQ2162926.1 type III pantothenate kinase [Bacteroidales bacterium]